MINAAVFGFVDSVASPYLVLPLFVNALGGSSLLVGLLPAIANGGWYFPQFLISHRLQRMPRKLGVYIQVAVVRMVCWGLLTVATFLLASAHTTLLVLFFVLYTAYCFASGLSGTPFMDIVAKIIPPGQRGMYFGRRDLLGGLAAIAAGYLVNFLLNPQRAPAFPLNFGFLFAVSGVAIAVGLGAFSLTVEPAENAPADHVTFREQLRAARRIVRDNYAYRRYLLTRIALAIADVATPFYAIYAVSILHAPPEIVGMYIGVSTAASLLTNPLWSRLSAQRGTRLVLIGAASGVLVMPVIALVFGLLPAGPWLGLPFGLLFIVAGVTRPAANIAYPSYLLEIAPAHERSLYLGFTFTVLGLATFVPVIGGALLDLWGFRVLLLLALAISALAWWLARGLSEPRHRAFQ